MIDNYARNVIDKFEYSEAKEFYYFDQIPFEKCTPNVRNILLQLKPVAVYMVQGRPFVSFFYCTEAEKRNMAWQIWNAQLYFKNNNRDIQWKKSMHRYNAAGKT